MARPSLSVTDAELGVLKTLWDQGSSTIRELTDRLYPDGGTAHYATVQKLLERLEGKSCVTRRAEGRRGVYSAAVERYLDSMVKYERAYLVVMGIVHGLTNRRRKPATVAPWALSVMAPGGTAIMS